MIPATAARLASLSAEWLRVGFCQGNFNADNCLVGGRTMDYGPFGFMDKYDPAFAKWTGSGNHFAFMNQPAAVRQLRHHFGSISPISASFWDYFPHFPRAFSAPSHPTLSVCRGLLIDHADRGPIGAWNPML